MKFSILIANYNNGRFFKDCYESILGQSYSNWEAIIVDDCSSDDSVTLIESLIKDDNRFKLYQNESNCGCGYTKARCIDLAEGDFCGYLDPDDALLPHAIEKMMDEYEKNLNTVLIHSTYYICDQDLVKIRIYEHARQVNNEDPFFFNYGGHVTHLVTFSRAAYFQTEGIDTYMQRAVDQDLYLKLAEVGMFQFIPEPLYLYRVHDGGISNSINGDKTFYWHWYTVMQAAKRRNVNIESLFTEKFVNKSRFDKLSSSVQNSEFYKLSAFFAPLIKLLKK